VLGEDFVIVDVLRGNEVDRRAFNGAISSGQMTVERIEPAERRVRQLTEPL
jgi:hypothetical protein